MSAFQDIISTDEERALVEQIANVLETIYETEKFIQKSKSQELAKSLKFFLKNQMILRSALQGDLNAECRQRAQRVCKEQREYNAILEKAERQK